MQVVAQNAFCLLEQVYYTWCPIKNSSSKTWYNQDQGQDQHAILPADDYSCNALMYIWLTYLLRKMEENWWRKEKRNATVVCWNVILPTSPIVQFLWPVYFSIIHLIRWPFSESTADNSCEITFCICSFDIGDCFSTCTDIFLEAYFCCFQSSLLSPNVAAGHGAMPFSPPHT